MNKTEASDSLPFLPLSKTRRQQIAALGTTRRRRKERLFCAEGHKSVEDLLDRCAGRFPPVWLVATRQYLVRMGECIGRRWNLSAECVSVASETDMRQMSSLSTPSEVMAVFRMPERSADATVAAVSPLPEGLYLLLDGVQDPGNIGTIIRTAHWFGINRIFASRDTVDLYNPKTVQSTMGSLGAVAVDYVDLSELVDANRHIPLVGLQLDGADICKASLPPSAMICMGSEGNGLSEAVRGKLDMSLTIPPYDAASHPESLNVAVATAITLAAFRGSVNRGNAGIAPSSSGEIYS